MATWAEISKVLRTKTEKDAMIRARKMHLTPVCDRCGGCGRYSFNQIDGDRCYGCDGSGHVVPKTAAGRAALLQAANEAASDGRLNAYIAARIAERKLKTASDQFFAAWKAVDFDLLSDGSKSHWMDSVTIRKAITEGHTPSVRESEILRRSALNARIAEAYKPLHNKMPRNDADIMETSHAFSALMALVADIAAEVETNDLMKIA